MKVVAYSIKPFEKEYLVKANHKKHDITLISNRLTPETVGFAEGKDAIIVFTDDDLSEPVIYKLKELGVRFIATRSTFTDHIDKNAAAICNIKLANTPNNLSVLNATSTESVLLPETLAKIADQTIQNLNLWQAEKCVGNSCVCAHNCRAARQPVTNTQDNISTFLP